jgi:hypothetical protein
VRGGRDLVAAQSSDPKLEARRLDLYASNHEVQKVADLGLLHEAHLRPGDVQIHACRVEVVTCISKSTEEPAHRDARQVLELVGEQRADIVELFGSDLMTKPRVGTVTSPQCTSPRHGDRRCDPRLR